MSKRKRTKTSLARIIVFAALTLWGVTQVLPLIWLVNASLRDSQSIIRFPLGIANPIQWKNYAVAWTGTETGIAVSRYMLNSVLVVGSSLIFMVFMATLAAYAFARFQFRGKKILFIYFISLIAVPAHTLAIPLYKMMKDMNLINNFLGLILIYASGVSFSILILQSFFRTVPKAIEEAAIVDGASYFRAFRSIILPISKGAVAAIAIISFIGLWSELLYSMIILWNDFTRTLPVGVLSFNGQWGQTEYGYLYAALSLATLPMVAFYLVFKDFILKGMTLGAVK